MRPSSPTMAYLYSGTRAVGTALARKKISAIQQKRRDEKLENQKLRRELRVLRRIKFDMSEQLLHVQVSLKLINHVSPR